MIFREYVDLEFLSKQDVERSKLKSLQVLSENSASGAHFDKVSKFYKTYLVKRC